LQQYIIRRTLLNVVVVWIVATLVFGALRLDSDNIVNKQAGQCAAGGDIELYEQCVATTKQALGLDKSIFEQYTSFMSDLVRLDLGHSLIGDKDPITDEIRERALVSIELGLLQLAFGLIIAVPIGIISAIRQDTWIDYILRAFSILLLGIPAFVLAVVIILLTSKYAATGFLADWLTPSATYTDFVDPFGWTSNESDPWHNMQNMFAPALIGGLGSAAIIMRFLRSQMLEVLRQDYVRTAWAKGLRERVIISRHALKNALIPVLTIVGIILGTLVSGNVVLESIYGLPGVGQYVVFKISQTPDYPAVQGVVIVVAVTLVFINLLIDITYAWLDPRIRYS
jgi:peptide/nickel transport system permease protein